jgi:hypothetical protein
MMAPAIAATAWMRRPQMEKMDVSANWLEVREAPCTRGREKPRATEGKGRREQKEKGGERRRNLR